jgi:hypothetical protein
VVFVLLALSAVAGGAATGRSTNWDVWELQQMVTPGIPATLQE